VIDFPSHLKHEVNEALLVTTYHFMQQFLSYFKAVFSILKLIIVVGAFGNANYAVQFMFFDVTTTGDYGSSRVALPV